MFYISLISLLIFYLLNYVLVFTINLPLFLISLRIIPWSPIMKMCPLMKKKLILETSMVSMIPKWTSMAGIKSFWKTKLKKLLEKLAFNFPVKCRDKLYLSSCKAEISCVKLGLEWERLLFLSLEYLIN